MSYSGNRRKKLLRKSDFRTSEFWKTADVQDIDDLKTMQTDMNATSADGLTLLTMAVLHNRNPRVIKALIAAGADIEKTNGNGVTACWMGVRNKAPETVTLIEAGADVNASDNEGVTPLMIAAEEHFNDGLMEFLIEHGADVNAQTYNDGRTPLLIAAGRGGQTSSVLILLSAGADVSVRDNDGRTPLYAAAEKNPTPDLLNILIAAGIGVDVPDNDGKTPLMATVSHNTTPAVVQTLIKAGANVNARAKDGKTPLIFAADKRRPDHDVITALMENGADPEIRDLSGRKAADYLDPDARGLLDRR